MIINSKSDFITAINQLNIDTQFVFIKPNWINNKEGEYTDSKILGWLLEAIPDSKKIVIEGYTPWRGLIYEPGNDGNVLDVDLEGGKRYRDFYRSMDEDYLKTTGIGDLLAKYDTEYINITECVWDQSCVPPENITEEINRNGCSLSNPEFAGYFPTRLFELREKATFVSLTKIKSEFHIPVVGFSATIKNLLGLIPDPSRAKYHTGENMVGLDTALADIFLLYSLLFRKTKWIAEGIFTLPMEPFSPNPAIMKNQNIIFLGGNPIKVDTDVCGYLNLEPESSDYFRLIKTIVAKLKLFNES